MPACMKLAVAGPTARVGSRVVELLEASGHDVVPMSRSTGVVTGEGLAEALAGVECVIEVAGGNAASPAGKSSTPPTRRTCWRDPSPYGCCGLRSSTSSFPSSSSGHPR